MRCIFYARLQQISRERGVKSLEETYKIEPIGVKYICDKCKEGEMLPTGNNDWATNPPQFEHACTFCNQIENFEEKYPLVRFKVI